ncbi:zinc finger MYM-type protein 1-like [Canna indica]|uniref:Zinc finger MYM-type protein 1-like n=1 Tax=Canna indica TaxID=4628 RepID=A0AAQ3KJG5_9LILI|nr:zinc finger MYM-type protein 1-like [Canna indica]
MSPIPFPNMDETYCPKERSKCRVKLHTFSNYFKVELFNQVIDSQLQELNDRFDNVNTSLIECLSYLDPREKFASFNR